MKRLLFLFPWILFAVEGTLEVDQQIKPWMTGPILATSGNVIQVGHFNIEPYILGNCRTHFYNSDWEPEKIDTYWNIQSRVITGVGVTEWMDFKFSPIWNWNYREGQTNWTMGDWIAQIDIQLHRDQLPHKSWLPSIKLVLREVFPTGRYSNLDPKKRGTDGDGMGAWRTLFGLAASKMFYFGGYRFLNLYLNVAYSIPTSVHVEGFNAYGGGFGTDGVVKPERIFQAVFSVEYEISRHWGVACDFYGTSFSKISFSGNPGQVPFHDSEFDPFGIPAQNQKMAAIQYGMAPAVEYNWNENWGGILGIWFTVAGKNTSRFTSAVLALNYYR